MGVGLPRDVSEIGKRSPGATEVATGWLELSCPNTMTLLSCVFLRS